MSCQKRRRKKKQRKKNEKQLTCHRSRNPRRVCSRTGAEPQRRTPTPLTSLNKTQRKHTQLTLLLASTGFLYLFPYTTEEHYSLREDMSTRHNALWKRHRAFVYAHADALSFKYSTRAAAATAWTDSQTRMRTGWIMRCPVYCRHGLWRLVVLIQSCFRNVTLSGSTGIQVWLSLMKWVWCDEWKKKKKENPD